MKPSWVPSFTEALGVPHLIAVPTPSCALTSWAPGYLVKLGPLRDLGQAAVWVEVLQWHLKAQWAGPGRRLPQGREGTPDSPLVIRLPKGKTGKGLVLPGGPAEGVLSRLVGEPWAMAAKVGPITQDRGTRALSLLFPA